MGPLVITDSAQKALNRIANGLEELAFDKEKTVAIIGNFQVVKRGDDYSVYLEGLNVYSGTRWTVEEWLQAHLDEV